MKKLELSVRERVAFCAVLDRQGGPNAPSDLRGMTVLMPFYRVGQAIRLTADERKACNYRVVEEGTQVRILWDEDASNRLGPREFMIDSQDAESCVALLKRPDSGLSTSDMDWASKVSNQMLAEDVPVNSTPPATSTSAPGSTPGSIG